jgi:hypothetical protein
MSETLPAAPATNAPRQAMIKALAFDLMNVVEPERCQQALSIAKGSLKYRRLSHSIDSNIVLPLSEKIP